MARGQKTSPEAIARRELQDQALRLRKQGKTYAEIAEEMGGIERSTANRYVLDAMKEITRESAEDVLQITLSRLDDIVAGSYFLAAAGDKDAANIVMKAEDRRARLYGLYKLAEQKVAGEAREMAAVDAFFAGILGGQADDDTPIDQDAIAAELAAIRPDYAEPVNVDGTE